jgi:hypothetical protein
MSNHHQSNGEETDIKMLPLFPISASENWKTYHTFLMSLSSNENYKKLLFLHVVKIRKQSFGTCIGQLVLRMVTSWRNLDQHW